MAWESWGNHKRSSERHAYISVDMPIFNGILMNRWHIWSNFSKNDQNASGIKITPVYSQKHLYLIISTLHHCNGVLLLLWLLKVSRTKTHLQVCLTGSLSAPTGPTCPLHCLTKCCGLHDTLSSAQGTVVADLEICCRVNVVFGTLEQIGGLHDW